MLKVLLKTPSDVFNSKGDHFIGSRRILQAIRRRTEKTRTREDADLVHDDVKRSVVEQPCEADALHFAAGKCFSPVDDRVEPPLRDQPAKFDHLMGLSNCDPNEITHHKQR